MIYQKCLFYLLILFNIQMFSEELDILRDEWIEAVESQELNIAEEIYKEIESFCSLEKDELTSIDCSIIFLMKKNYLAENDSSNTQMVNLDAINILNKIKNEEVKTFGTFVLLDILIENIWVFDDYAFDQLQSNISWHKERFPLDKEYKINLLDSEAFLFSEIFDLANAEKNLRKIIEMIDSFEDEDKEYWSEYKKNIQLRFITKLYEQGKEIETLEFALVLMSELITKKDTTNSSSELIDLFIFLGNIYFSNGDDIRSEIFYRVAYSYLINKKNYANSLDLAYSTDLLVRKLLPSLDCEESDSFINFLNSFKNKLLDQGIPSEWIFSESSENSMLISNLYCEENNQKKAEISTIIFSNIEKQIQESISSNLSTDEEFFIPEPTYFLNKLSAAYDIKDSITKSDYLNILSLVQSHIKNSIQQDPDILSYTDFILDYIFILSEGLCSLPYKIASENISLIYKLFEDTEVIDYLGYLKSISIKEDLFLNLLLIPSSCGYADQLERLYDNISKINISSSLFNAIPEKSYSYPATSLLTKSKFGDKNIQETIIQDMMFFNREPKEVEFKLNSENDKDFLDYLEFQSKLGRFEQSMLNFNTETSSSLYLFREEIEEFAQNTRLNLSEISDKISQELFYNFKLSDIKSNLSNNEALLLYSYYWIEVDGKIEENLTQLCITNEKIFLSSKNINEDISDTIFNINNLLLEDLVLNESKSKEILVNYTNIFSNEFKCNPKNFSSLFIITDFQDYFNPNLFYYDDYYLKSSKYNTYSNIYNFLEREESSIFKHDEYIGFGDVDYSNTLFNNLPDTKDEVLLSSKYFSKKKVFLGKQANKDSLSNSTNALIHFAVHNDSIDYRYNSNVEALVLSTNLEDDRYLSSVDISKKSFDDSFIILSACNTRNPKANSRNSTSSLFNSFLIAGATGLVSTTWDIDSAASKEFITKFLKKLSTNGKAQDNFVETQIEMINSLDFNHPYYWAGFNLYL